MSQLSAEDMQQMADREYETVLCGAIVQAIMKDPSGVTKDEIEFFAQAKAYYLTTTTVAVALDRFLPGFKALNARAREFGIELGLPESREEARLAAEAGGAKLQPVIEDARVVGPEHRGRTAFMPSGRATQK